MQTALVNGPAPPRPGPAYEVIRLKAGRSLDGIILSPAVWGYFTHWIQRGKTGYSVECVKERSRCLCDAETLPTRWKGYFHVWDLQRSREAFLELTTAVAETLLRWPQVEGDFRGYRFRAQRGKGSDNSRLALSFTSPVKVHNLEDLPAPKDPRPFLETLWSLAKPKDENFDS